MVRSSLSSNQFFVNFNFYSIYLLIKFWHVNRTFNRFQTLSLNVHPVPIVNNSDPISVSFLCAFYNQNRSQTKNVLSLNSPVLVENDIVLFLKLALSEQDDRTKLIKLVLTSFNCESSFNDLCKIISAHFDLKQIFEILCPELIFQSLVCIGKYIKTGNDYSKVSLLFNITIINLFLSC